MFKIKKVFKPKNTKPTSIMGLRPRDIRLLTHSASLILLVSPLSASHTETRAHTHTRTRIQASTKQGVKFTRSPRPLRTHWSTTFSVTVHTKFTASFPYSCGFLPGPQKPQPLITLWIMVLLLYFLGPRGSSTLHRSLASYACSGVFPRAEEQTTSLSTPKAPWRQC